MCLHPSGHKCTAVPHHTHNPVGREGTRRGGRGLLPAAVPLFPTPDQRPRCARRQQQQFEQCKSPVGPGTCKCILSLWHNSIITALTSVHLERRISSQQIKPPDRRRNTGKQDLSFFFLIICVLNKSYSVFGSHPATSYIMVIYIYCRLKKNQFYLFYSVCKDYQLLWKDELIHFFQIPRFHTLKRRLYFFFM